LSKIFFETVTAIPVDESTNSAFEKLIDGIVELKKQGKSTLPLEKEIDIKLAKIYLLSDSEIKLFNSTEAPNGTVSPDITAISESVNL